MKLVKELLFEKFTEDSDPVSDMGIGRSKIIKELLDKIYRDKLGGFKILPNGNIEITYYPYPVKIRDGIYEVKYVEKDRFFVDESSYEMSSFTHSFGTKYEWIIKELKFSGGRWAEDFKFYDELFLDMKKTPENKEYMDYICECLNKKYGKVPGFEYVKTIKQPED